MWEKKNFKNIKNTKKPITQKDFIHKPWITNVTVRPDPFFLGGRTETNKMSEDLFFFLSERDSDNFVFRKELWCMKPEEIELCQKKPKEIVRWKWSQICAIYYVKMYLFGKVPYANLFKVCIEHIFYSIFYFCTFERIIQFIFW